MNVLAKLNEELEARKDYTLEQFRRCLFSSFKKIIRC